MNTIRILAVTALSLTLSLGIAAAAFGAKTLPYHGEGHIMGTPDKLEWGPVKSMGAGAEIAVIEGNMAEEEPFTIRLRLEDGYEVLPHTHPAYERVTVLSGTLHFAHGETYDPEATQALPEGGFAIMAPGDPMFGYAEGETVIQVHGEGPWGIEYLNAEDDPRQ